MDDARSGSGDLGRRVAFRRRELGLTLDQLADRAGMAAGYLSYLESRPAQPPIETVFRLAGALQTTPEELLGGTVDVPPGGRGGSGQPRLVELAPDECWELVRPGGVGRVVFSTSQAPVAVPVNYSVVEDTVRLRTAPGSAFAQHLGEEVSFEVDHLDEAQREGWSVLITGSSAEAEGSETELTTWAGCGRDLYVSIRPDKITGRRIVAH